MAEDRLLPLCSLVAAAARGDGHGTADAVARALAAGCSVAEVREALRTLPPFCGFPRALDALSAAAPVLAAHAPATPDETESGPFAARGRALFDRVYGPEAPRVLDRLQELDPLVAAWVLEDAYGRVLSRPELGAAARERLAVALLAAQGLRNQLAGHVRGALRCGATAEEIEATLGAAAPWTAAGDLEAARATLRGAGGPRPA